MLRLSERFLSLTLPSTYPPQRHTTCHRQAAKRTYCRNAAALSSLSLCGDGIRKVARGVNEDKAENLRWLERRGLKAYDSPERVAHDDCWLADHLCDKGGHLYAHTNMCTRWHRGNQRRCLLHVW